MNPFQHPERVGSSCAPTTRIRRSRTTRTTSHHPGRLALNATDMAGSGSNRFRTGTLRNGFGCPTTPTRPPRRVSVFFSLESRARCGLAGRARARDGDHGDPEERAGRRDAGPGLSWGRGPSSCSSTGITYLGILLLDGDHVLRRLVGVCRSFASGLVGAGQSARTAGASHRRCGGPTVFLLVRASLVEGVSGRIGAARSVLGTLASRPPPRSAGRRRRPGGGDHVELLHPASTVWEG